jgi:hypothetical protein
VDRPLGQPPDQQDYVANVLTVNPDAIISDSTAFDRLAAVVDDLRRRAAPATASTIRLTSAYLRMPIEGREPPEPVMQRARKLRRIMFYLVVLAVIATFVSVVLLA